MLVRFLTVAFMAKNRMVSTAFWSDHYVASLDPVEKLLFLYLLTNERSTLAGIYELPIKIMAVETGIDVFMVEKILGRFEGEEKIKYHDGWVAVKNFLKHHEHGSPTVQKGINDAIKSAPEWARQFVGKGIDTLSPSASSLSSTKASISEPKVRVEIVSEDEKPKKQSTAKYPNARKLFKELWGPSYPLSWNTNNTMLQSGENLYSERGIDKCKEAMQFVKDFGDRTIGVQTCPQILTPIDLDRKWLNLEAFSNKLAKII